jgi:hypothetical protein
MSEELMFGFKKKIVNRYYGNDKDSRDKTSEKRKQEHMKDPYKNFGTKVEKSKKVQNSEEEDIEKKSTIFNK